MEYETGQIVYSKSGHDKGGIFVILSVEGEYVYLANGKNRSLEKPKRKKIYSRQNLSAALCSKNSIKKAIC